MFELSKNTFSKGMSSDIDPRMSPQGTYIDAVNCRLVGDSDVASIKSMESSLNMYFDMFPDADPQTLNILNVTEVVSQGDKCFAIFAVYKVSGVATSKVIKYNITKDTLSNVTPLSGSLDFPIEGVIDTEVYAEDGKDWIYFDDHKNPLRRICLDDSALPYPEYLLVQKLSATDPIEFYAIEEGVGQLPAGTIQIAYRYYNTATNTYSTWSLFTNPIPVYPSSISTPSLDAIHGGVAGEICNKSIKVKIKRTIDNYKIYNSYQLGIIKNNVTNRPDTTVYITPPVINLSVGDIVATYDGSQLETTDLYTNIVVDDAPIANAKTLMVKDSVLFRGNVNYFDRYVNNVTFSGAETIKRKIGLSSNSYNIGELNDNNPDIDTANFTYSSMAYPLEDFKTEFGSENVDKNSFYVANEDLRYGALAGNPINDDINEAELCFGNGDSPSLGYAAQAGKSMTVINDVEAGNIYQVTYSESNLALRQAVNLVGSPINEFGIYDESWNSFVAMHKYYFRAASTDMLITETSEDFSDRIISTMSIDNNIISSTRTITYIAKQGDTSDDVAYALATQLNAVSSSYVEVLSSGSVINITTSFPLDTGGSLNKTGAAFFTYSVGKGGNVSEQSITIDDITDPESVSGGYKNPNNFVNSKGYFRDELYRFGVVYKDKYGNWSNPVALDFSSMRAKNTVGSPIAVLSCENTFDNITPNHGTLRLTIDATISDIDAGDLVVYSDSSNTINGDYLVLHRDATYIYIASGEVDSSEFIGKTGQTITKTVGGEYNWAESGTDWKFPARNNKKFAMVDQDDADDLSGGLYPIGLKISGITDHPSWAVAMAIVRTRRIKDVVWQSPHIPAIAAMPSMNITGDTCVPQTGASPLGSFGPKVSSKGLAKNFERESSIVTGAQQLSSRKAQQFDRSNIMPISVCYPSELMYQYNGTSYNAASLPPNATVKTVDAITMFRTEAYASGGIGTSNGSSEDDQMGTGLRADNAVNYYYRKHNGLIDFGSCKFSQLSGAYPDYGKAAVISTGALAYGSSPYVFPTYPKAGSFSLDKLLDINGLESVSFQNCGINVFQEKGVAMLLDKDFGDLCLEAKGRNSITTPAVGTLRFDNETEATKLSSAYNLSDLAITDVDNRQELLPSYSGVVSVAPIINYTTGQSDSRYGNKEDIHEYIFTGAYAVISSPSQVVDIEVFGGDCFITKTNVKISSSTVEEFSNKIKAYQGLHEILSCYIESEVCSDLQTGRYTYPVISRNSLGEFKAIYLYPYNFGYSVQNEVKTWTTYPKTYKRRNEYPERIIYSDQKVLNSNVNGFDRFRALSFYDMQGGYGAICKLDLLPSDKPVCVQRNAVSYIPINKNIVEDGGGNQMLINSTTLINTPQYASTTIGSSNLKSCVRNHEGMFFIDADKKVLAYVGGGVDSVSEQGLLNTFKQVLESGSGIPDSHIVAGYDYTNKELFIGYRMFEDSLYYDGVNTPYNKTGTVYIWSDITKSFVSRFQTAGTLHSVAYGKSDLFIIGENGDVAYLDKMYNGNDYGVFFGTPMASNFLFSINDKEDFGKTFDVLRIDSRYKPNVVILDVLQNDNNPTQNCVIDMSAIKDRHLAYEVASTRDANGARLRGKAMFCRIIINGGRQEQVSINSVLTKYRLSGRIFK